MFKDQTSMIVFIVAVLLGAIGIGTVYFTKPDPAAVTPVETVPLAPAALPAAGVTYANALPGASGGGATGAPAGSPFGGAPGASAPTRTKTGAAGAGGSSL